MDFYNLMQVAQNNQKSNDKKVQKISHTEKTQKERIKKEATAQLEKEKALSTKKYSIVNEKKQEKVFKLEKIDKEIQKKPMNTLVSRNSIPKENTVNSKSSDKVKRPPLSFSDILNLAENNVTEYSENTNKNPNKVKYIISPNSRPSINSKEKKSGFTKSSESAGAFKNSISIKPNSRDLTNRLSDTNNNQKSILNSKTNISVKSQIECKKPKLNGIAAQFGVPRITQPILEVSVGKKVLQANKSYTSDRHKLNTLQIDSSHNTSKIVNKLSTHDARSHYCNKRVNSGIAAQLSVPTLNCSNPNIFKEKGREKKKFDDDRKTNSYSNANIAKNNCERTLKRPHLSSADSAYRNYSSSMPSSQPNARSGIAAQFGVTAPQKSLSYSSEEEEEWESELDDFIDDSEVVTDKEYSKAIKEIQKSLKFDPKKYAKVNKYDDCSNMEASFNEINREESRSARLAAVEDAELLAEELARRKFKQAKYR